MKKGQSVIQNAVFLIFIIVSLIVVSIMASATTPFINALVTEKNITGGMAIVARHFNLIMVLVLSIIGLITVYFLGGARE